MAFEQSRLDIETNNGLCGCGCGEKTRIATKTDRKAGQIRGKPLRFIIGHHRRKTPLEFLVEDRGYLTPCRIWQRAISHGYGVRRIDGCLYSVHIFEWEKVNGPVPPGLELDHLCRVRACAEPSHLEPVTPRENQARGIKGRLTTQCPVGHPYDSVNTYVDPEGHRRCRTCHREEMRRARQSKVITNKEEITSRALPSIR